MRVIAGTQKGRRLKTPTGKQIRPTSERVREALFSILGERIVQARVLDLCCGTGTIGLEALSRGARNVVFIDHDKQSLDILRENLKRCGNPVAATVMGGDAWKFSKQPQLHHYKPYDVIFVDPPYEHRKIHQLVVELGRNEMLAENGLMIVEHFWKTSLPQETDTLQHVRQARYGDTILTFFERSTQAHANRRLSGNV